MKEVVQFIESHWQYFSFALLAIVEIVLFVIKKRSKVEIYDDSACSELLDLIIQAESKIGSGHGAEKLCFVINSYIKKHPSLKGYESIIQSIVERILKSPQKKGVSYEKSDEKV